MNNEGWIRWLSEVSKDDTSLVGGKGANLGEMYNSKFPVPQAFIVTTEAYDFFLEKTGLREQIDSLLQQIDVNNTEQLDSKAKEIRELIKQAEFPQELRQEILEAYDNFNVDLQALKGSPDALAIMRSAREPVFVSARSSATAEDTKKASFAGQQESFINIKGNVELIEKVATVFASTFTARAIFYRKNKGFDMHVPIAVVVQKMINSDKSGVMFSKNPVNSSNEILIEAVFGQGEGIVSGKIKPDQFTVSEDLEITKEELANKKLAIVRDASGITKTIQLTPEKTGQKTLKNYEIKKLAEYAQKLEEHYEKPQDIEFAVEGEDIYILQTRPITTLKESKHERQDLQGNVLLSGLAASPGISSGPVRIVLSMEDLQKIKKGDVLVTKMTNPDMVVSMQKAAAIVTDEGGVTSHAAIVSREMGIPAIVGTDEATSKLKEGQEITVDGFTGKVFQGEAEDKEVEILPVVDTKTKIKVNVDLPDFAERAAKAKSDGIGLVRIEGIIASSGKHPIYFKENNKLSEYTEILKAGLEKIAQSFVGKEIWIRTSDMRSDEYSNLEGAPKEIEKNPMLGFHGIRYSLKNKEIFKAELQAVKDLINKGHKFGLMFPQIISVEEVKKAKEILNELGMLKNPNLKVGIMIETPAATILIKDFCEEGIDFISFGTNDLTQYTLAIDRNNEDVQYIYNDLDWAVRKQISRVIRECKFHKVETSICGQAGSKKEMVEFLIKQGIDSISVNADAAHKISKVVQELESQNIKPPHQENKPNNSEKQEIPQKEHPPHQNNPQKHQDHPKHHHNEQHNPKQHHNHQEKHQNNEHKQPEKPQDNRENDNQIFDVFS
jgi:pyruvate, water dikinase